MNLNIEKRIEKLNEQFFDITGCSTTKGSRELIKAMDALSARERDILKMRFGFKDGIYHTLKEIGQRLGLSGGYVYQRNIKALIKLRFVIREQKMPLKTMEPEEVLKASISYLHLSGRTRNALYSYGTYAIGELTAMKTKDVKHFHGTGKKSLIEIQAKLLELNLRLSD